MPRLPATTDHDFARIPGFVSSLHADWPKGRKPGGNRRNSFKISPTRADRRFVERGSGVAIGMVDFVNPNRGARSAANLVAVAGIGREGGGILRASRPGPAPPEGEGRPFVVPSFGWGLRDAGVSLPEDRAEVAGVLGEEQDVPNPRPRPGQAQALRPRHVPVPERRRAPRRPSRGVHRHRHLLPVQEDEGVQRPPPDGLGRLRPPRRAVRHQDRHAPSRNDPEERRQLPPADQEPRVLVRLGARGQHHRPRLLQMDPVDLPEDPRHLVRPGFRVDRPSRDAPEGQGAADRRIADPRGRRPGGVPRLEAAGLSR